MAAGRDRHEYWSQEMTATGGEHGLAQSSEPSMGRVLATGVLAWLLPGLGHIFNGDRKRGLILLIVIAATFWGGVAVAGVQSTFEPRGKTLWFMAQICAGGHTLLGMTWGEAVKANGDAPLAGFVATDVAVIYTGVAGLLNIMVIIDALLATDPRYSRANLQRKPQPSEAT
jgi:hypothetical protein